MGIRRIISDLAGVVFPPLCPVCGRRMVDGEKLMCLECLDDLPRTNIHSDRLTRLFEKVANTSVPIERVASWFDYAHDSDYVRLIHDIKYRGRSRLGREAGRVYASELSPTGFFDGIDLLIPVPLHWTKLIRRGYNQSKEIARGISDVTSIPLADNLYAAKAHSTQVNKGAQARLSRASGTFRANPDGLDGRHVLIVDDVLTTGSTMLACAEALMAASPTTRVSVLTLGATRLHS